MQLKNKKIVELLEERDKVSKQGLPYFDKIEEIVTKVIKNNMPRIATDPDMWKYLKPYIDADEFKKANGELGEQYRQLQKLEYKMNRLKDKISSELAKENIKLKEFEEIGTVSLNKGKAEVVILDKVEEYKKMLRERENED